MKICQIEKYKSYKKYCMCMSYDLLEDGKLNRQLWSTRLDDMKQTCKTKLNCVQCINCLRPLSDKDLGNRKMTYCDSFHQMLNKCELDEKSMFVNEQRRLLLEGLKKKYIWLCFICSPAWKKCRSQNYNENELIESPLLFMENSFNFMKKNVTVTDKLSLLKFIICTSSEVTIQETKEIIYHPVRSCDFVSLENSIIFFRYVFEKKKCNVRDFDLCPFEMVSICKWHVSGFPILMNQSRHTQDLRKAIRGRVGVLYKNFWEWDLDFYDIQCKSVDSNTTQFCACAKCCYEQDNSEQNEITCYDSCFLPTLKELKHKIQNIQQHKPDIVTEHILVDSSRKSNIVAKKDITICKIHRQKSIISFKFYSEIKRRFPHKFQQTNVRRYYTRILHESNNV